jgi:hypothetical protein
MWNPANPGNVSAWEQTKKAALAMDVIVQPAPVPGADQLDGVFALANSIHSPNRNRRARGVSLPHTSSRSS